MKKVRLNRLRLEEFLAQMVVDNNTWLTFFKTRLKKEPVTVAIHNHCHQQSLVGPEPTKTLFDVVPGGEV